MHANGHSDARANAQAVPLAAPSQPAPKLQVAVVGLGQVGRACAEALLAGTMALMTGHVPACCGARREAMAGML
eukprot:gene39985-63783_t